MFREDVSNLGIPSVQGKVRVRGDCGFCREIKDAETLKL